VFENQQLTAAVSGGCTSGSEATSDREGEGERERDRGRDRERQTIAYRQLISCYQELPEFPFAVFPTLKKTSNNIP
jgi:hypothetical protein